MPLSDEHFCPVPESLLGRLYRSSPEGIAALVKTVPSTTRAMLAYYCSRRAHFQTLAFVIAGTCSAEELYDVAGRAGWDLFAKAKASEQPEPPKRKSRQGVTLASGALWHIPAVEE